MENNIKYYKEKIDFLEKELEKEKLLYNQLILNYKYDLNEWKDLTIQGILTIEYIKKYYEKNQHDNNQNLIFIYINDNEDTLTFYQNHHPEQKEIIDYLINEYNEYLNFENELPTIFEKSVSHFSSDISFYFNCSNENKNNKLLYACGSAFSYKSVSYLLTKNYNLNIKTDLGYTPLMLSIFRKCYEITDLLLSKGANINEKCNNKNTALIYSIKCFDLKSFNLLIKYGANINDIDEDGNNILFFLIYYYTHRLFIYQKHINKSYNYKDKLNITLYNNQAMNDHMLFPFIISVIKINIDLKFKNKDNMNALEYCFQGIKDNVGFNDKNFMELISEDRLFKFLKLIYLDKNLINELELNNIETFLNTNTKDIMNFNTMEILNYLDKLK